MSVHDTRAEFSNKEREKSGELDYFGIRFLSVGPIRNKNKAIVTLQSWNLSAYCGNNMMGEVF